ncbi:hypothetical protein G6F37_002990 [Rhizopus arrhizus]|nr:hypothetical protein G6F38_009751 [Rhizopus arrhizus]KAG1161542.1 hypothetical protein G6F37_002990 [Rhizopus arrhizus]
MKQAQLNYLETLYRLSSVKTESKVRGLKIELLSQKLRYEFEKLNFEKQLETLKDMKYKAKQDYENKLRDLKERMETKNSLLNEQLEKQKVL